MDRNEKAGWPQETNRRTTTQDAARSELIDIAQRRLVLSCVHPVPRRRVADLVHGLTLGRGERSRVLLDGAGVSRDHARVVGRGPLLILEDRGSRNGTFVDGQRVAQEALGPGSVIRIGDWVGVVETVDDSSAGNSAMDSAELVTAGPLLDVLSPLRRVASSDLPVVLYGETGTGKEVVARALHQWSGRQGAFCALNCGAIPRDIAEAELFGYRRGAFSGADSGNVGHFRAAHGGTLLLDEINDLDVNIQRKLLRALQERQVSPLGEVRPVPANVRVIASGQTPLATAVAAGHFRADLWMRLRGLEVTLPPLRERIVDVPVLFHHFLKRYASGRPPEVEARLIEQLCLYPWPGNVRELQLVAQQLVTLHPDAALLKCRMLPHSLRDACNDGDAEIPPGTLLERDRARLVKALNDHASNVSRASRAMGISRQRAYRLMGGVAVQEFLERHAEQSGLRGAVP